MKKVIFFGLLFALVVFLAAAALSLSIMSAHRGLDIERSHAFDVIRTLDSLVDSIMNAEAAWGNYAGTRDPRYLAAYNSAVNETIKYREELKREYSGRRVNMQFEELFVLVNSRINLLMELVDSVAEGAGAANQAEILRREEQVNNAFFRAIQALEKHETAEIVALDAKMETFSRESLYALLTGTVLNVIIFSGLFYFLYRQLQERKRLEEAIKRQAHHDLLTGLPNRLAFMERLGYEITQAGRSRQRFAVMFLDLDHFKDVNDSLGHEAGDELLKDVARRVTANIRESDTVARIGGDEFIILLTNISHTDSAALIAEKVTASFKEPFAISGQEIHSSSSIGISIYPEDGENYVSLLKNADIAMYHAKEQGRNNFKFYSSFLNRRPQEKTMLECSLRHTLEHNEMVLYYQPRIDIRKNEIVCVEALVRWLHPKMGILNPRDFISLAENIGFISSLDQWVLRTACAQARAWQNGDAWALNLAVNISLREFKSPAFVNVLHGILRETGLDPRSLKLEITEQTALDNVENTIAKVDELRRLGITLSIDHFGAAFTSLNSLKMLSLGRIKIDRSFIKAIDSSRNDRAIIKAIIMMAHNMGVKVVAEGVENRQQMRFLKANECDEVQGYLVCSPIPAEQFRKFVYSYGARAA